MADTISPKARSSNMRRITSTDTGPEILVRKLLFSLGYRYRLHAQDLPGKPDIVFRGRRKAIFVHGCFWHQHPGCQDSHTPKSRSEYWIPKLRRNVERDAQVLRQLRDQGWEVLIVWECETRDSPSLQERLCAFLGECKRGPG